METTTKYTFVEETESESVDTRCGIGRWKPRWMQFLANPKVYLINFSILGVLQSAFSAYLIGVMSTVEKRFAFDSKISGLILIADNISPILMAIPIGFYGGRAHRPRLIALTMFVVVLSCFMCSVPYFVYGPVTDLLRMPHNAANRSTRRLDLCYMDKPEEDCETASSSITLPAVTIFFIASFLEGIGSTAFYTIGTPYLDDNIKKKDSPLYFSSLFSFRMFGPVIGFLLASYSLKYYEDLSDFPGISTRDPRWIGAWWLGFLILGVLLFIFSLPMLLFPQKLPRGHNFHKESKSSKKEEPSPLKLKELTGTLLKLARNPILVCHTIGITFRIIGLAGYYILMPRYIESQYGKSASKANFFTGTTSLITMIIGVMLGGAVIRKFKPRPKYLTGYMAGVEFIMILGLALTMSFGCDNKEFIGTTMKDSGSLDLYNGCNRDCGCSQRVYEPVCTDDGKSPFFSACFAGCSSVVESPNSTTMEYVNCSCIPARIIQEAVGANVSNDIASPSSFSQPVNQSSLEIGIGEWVRVIGRSCPLDCSSFVPYILILSLCKVVASTSRVGNSLVTLRCVNPKDKSVALGVLNTVLSIFAFIPYPLIYGALADSVCLVWEVSCGTRGNCWIYDSQRFRHTLHMATIAFVLVGTFFDVAVFFLSGRLLFFYDDVPLDVLEESTKPPPTPLDEEEDEEIIFYKGKPYHSVSTIQPSNTN